MFFTRHFFFMISIFMGVFLVLTMGIPGYSGAQSPTLLMDIEVNRYPDCWSSPYNMFEFNGDLFFTAYDVIHGEELFVTDGTDDGTRLFRDINVGFMPSYPHGFVRTDTLFFFIAEDSTGSEILWVSDGTQVGTHSLFASHEQSGFSNPENLTAAGSTLFFTATTPAEGTELWKTDGTSAGTTLVRDIYPGTLSSSPYQLVALGSQLYFFATTATEGSELWTSDGSELGTVLVSDIYTGPTSSNPSDLTVCNGLLYFRANGDESGSSGFELWKSDGTDAGTIMVKDIYPGPTSSSPDYLYNHSDILYFSAMDNAYGQELWKSDGTDAGTVRVKDICPVSCSSYPSKFTSIGSTLFFVASDGTNGYELWKTDGTDGGTVLVRDIYTGSSSSMPNYLTSHNGLLYFSAGGNNSLGDYVGVELWVSDGTEAGTTVVKDIVPGTNDAYVEEIVSFNGSLFFSAYDGLNGQELWKSDGTEAGTFLYRIICQDETGSMPYGFTAFDSSCIMGLFNYNYYGALFMTDGTPGGSSLIDTLTDGVPFSFVEYNGDIYFLLLDFFTPEKSRQDFERMYAFGLFKLDGTTQTIDNVGFFVFDVSLSYFMNKEPLLVVKDNLLYFIAVYFPQSQPREPGPVDPQYGLWQSDGTLANTFLVSSLDSLYCNELTLVDTSLFFAGYPTGGGNARQSTEMLLFRSDGTVGSLSLEADISSPEPLIEVPFLTAVGSDLYFTTSSVGSGYELWKFDGITSTTAQVKDIFPGPEDSMPLFLTELNGNLFFVAHDGTNGYEIWKTDGSELGTTMVADIFPSNNNDFDIPHSLMPFKNELYFIANDGTHGYELWKTDGTAGGTGMVADIFPGVNSGMYEFSFESFILLSPKYKMTPYRNTLYLNANDGDNLAELWKTDGTTAGTVRVTDTTNFPGDFSIFSMDGIGDDFYLSADDGLWGYELYSMKLRPVYDSNPAPAATIDLGQCALGSSVSATLNVLQKGDADLEVTIQTGGPITGTHASDFSVTSGAPPLTIPWDDYTQKSITIQCLPSNIGIRQAILTFETNDPSQPIVTYLLQCSAFEPLAVQLRSFNAQLTKSGILLKWITESENDILGYNLYRSSKKAGGSQSRKVKLNSSLIAALGDATTGAKYKLLDTSLKVKHDYIYTLEAIATNGQSKNLAEITLDLNRIDGATQK